MAFSRSISNPTRRHQLIGAFGLFVIALLAVIGGARTRASATTPTPPANDNLGSATVLSGAAGRVWEDIDDATVQLGEPALAGSHTVWFKWTAPFTGQTSFSPWGDCWNPIGVPANRRKCW